MRCVRAHARKGARSLPIGCSKSFPCSNSNKYRFFLWLRKIKKVLAWPSEVPWPAACLHNVPLCVTPQSHNSSWQMLQNARALALHLATLFYFTQDSPNLNLTAMYSFAYKLCHSPLDGSVQPDAVGQILCGWSSPQRCIACSRSSGCALWTSHNSEAPCFGSLLFAAHLLFLAASLVRAQTATSVNRCGRGWRRPCHANPAYFRNDQAGAAKAIVGGCSCAVRGGSGGAMRVCLLPHTAHALVSRVNKNPVMPTRPPAAWVQPRGRSTPSSRTTDQAGHARRSFSNAFGGLIEADEPGAGATQATVARGSFSICCTAPISDHGAAYVTVGSYTGRLYPNQHGKLGRSLPLFSTTSSSDNLQSICFEILITVGWGWAAHCQFQFSSFNLRAGAGGVTSLGSRGVTEDVELPKELTPVTSHSIAFVEALLCTDQAQAQSGKYLLSGSGAPKGPTASSAGLAFLQGQKNPGGSRGEPTTGAATNQKGG